MKRSEAGFTVVELLVSLVVGSLLLISGYQLYGVVSTVVGEARQMSQASNIGYEVLRREGGVYQDLSEPCHAPERQTIHRSDITLPETTITMERCRPYKEVAVLRVVVIVRYGTPQKEVRHATYIAQ